MKKYEIKSKTIYYSIVHASWKIWVHFYSEIEGSLAQRIQKRQRLLLGDPLFSSYRNAFSVICICQLRDYHVFIFFCFLRFSKTLSLTLFLVFLDNDESTFDVIQYHLNNQRILLVTSSYLIYIYIYICMHIFEYNKTIYKGAIVHYTIDLWSKEISGSSLLLIFQEHYS